MGGTERRDDLLDHVVHVPPADDAFLDEPGRVPLAHRGLRHDALRLERLGVRRLVLLLVAEPTVADHVDHEVVPELLAVREREADRAESRLGVVGVHVDDRDVEPLREVAGVAGRAALGGIGREPDLVVRDQVQGPPRRVSVEALEVERLRHHPLPGEGGVAVDQDGQRDGRIMEAGAARAIGLLRPGPPLHHRVDRLEVTRVRRDRHLDLAPGRDAGAGRGQVVLHVAAAALGVDHQGVVGALALELAQHGLVRTPDRVDERVQPAAVGHPDHDLVRAARRGQLDRLVEHRHEHVEAFQRELLLPQERPPEVVLEAFHLAEAAQERDPLLRCRREAEAPRLDRLSQPDPLGVVRDVLDLVRARAHVDVAEAWQRLEQGLAGYREAEQARGDPRLQLGRQRGMQPGLVERRVAQRLGAEWIEPGGEVSVHPVGLDERHRGGDPREQLLVGGAVGRRSRRRLGGGRRRCACRGRRRRGRGRRDGGSGLGHGALVRRHRDVPRGCGRGAVPVPLEDPAPLVRHARRAVEVVLVELGDVRGVQARRLGRCHRRRVVAAAAAAEAAR